MDYFKELEETMTHNLNRRGMEGIKLTGELKKAAMSLKEADTVLIVTGFIIRDQLFGETDGPIGAVSIAGALDILGKNAIIATDMYSEEILRVALRAVDLDIALEIITEDGGDDFSTGRDGFSFSEDSSDLGDDNSDGGNSLGFDDDSSEGNFYGTILDKYRPDCLISIERPGEAEDGLMYSMTGECISSFVPSMDSLFREAKRRGLCTIGIGDGGNEIGMGKIRDYIVEHVPNGDIIAASFAADYLIVSGVSNWGAHALVAALSILTGRNLLYDVETGEKILRAIVDIGAVNGMTKQNALTVDGLGLEDNAKVVRALKDIIEKYIAGAS